MKRSTYNSKILVFVFVMLALLLFYIIMFFRGAKLKKDFEIASGEILTAFTTPKNSNVLVRYSFVVNGKIANGVSSTGCSDSRYYSLLNEVLPSKSMTVVFQKTNPDNSEMLFSTSDFERYKLTVPDNQKVIVKIIDSLLGK